MKTFFLLPLLALCSKNAFAYDCADNDPTINWNSLVAVCELADAQNRQQTWHVNFAHVCIFEQNVSSILRYDVWAKYEVLDHSGNTIQFTDGFFGQSSGAPRHKLKFKNGTVEIMDHEPSTFSSQTQWSNTVFDPLNLTAQFAIGEGGWLGQFESAFNVSLKCVSAKPGPR